MEETGERAAGADRIRRITVAQVPVGKVTAPERFGYPAPCAGGRPVWDDAHIPSGASGPSR